MVRRPHRTLLALLIVLVAVSATARLARDSRRWDPEGPPLEIHGVSLGMTESDLKSRGWQQEVWSSKDKVAHVVYERKNESAKDMLFVVFDGDGKVQALSGLGVFSQGGRDLFDVSSSDEQVLQVFEAATSTHAEPFHRFPQARAALTLTCPDGALFCPQHYQKGNDKGFGHHLFLGAVWEDQPGLGQSSRSGWTTIVNDSALQATPQATP